MIGPYPRRRDLLLGALATSAWSFAHRAAAQAAPSQTGLMIAALAQAPDHGLGPYEVAALRRQIDSMDPGERSMGLSDLVDDVIDYARAQHGLRWRPASINPQWGFAPANFDAGAELRAVRAADMAAWLAALAPSDPDYQRLLAARRDYTRILAAGGWASPTATAGDFAKGRSPAVAELRGRLAVEGYAAGATDDPQRLDEALVAQIKAYQARHALPADGKVSAALLAELRIPILDRLASIDANLERLRWLPRGRPADRVEVNIADQTLRLFRDGRAVLTMKTVVGDLTHHTPIFASALTSVVVNPPWNVPDSISKAELEPLIARDSGYMARNQFRYVDGHLQQAPGPKNALGRLKFDFPSPYGVYLHDTPTRSAFQKPQRALSHGCIRLEAPRELAAACLGWSPGQVDAAIKPGETTRLPLPAPVPVFVVYETAFVDDRGGLQFRPDLYGWDAQWLDLTHATTGRAYATADGAAP